MAAVNEYGELVAQLRAAGCVFAEDEARLLLAAAADSGAGTAAGDSTAAGAGTVHPATLQALVARRIAGEPLEYVLGWAAFLGHRIALEPGVFVPRRRTELLARQAISAARTAAVVVELCCGSGAIALAVARAVGGLDLHAADIDPVAVRCARANLAATTAQVHRGDLFAALPESLRGRVDVLIANAPYIPSEAIGLLPPEARLHEPRTALDGGADGLDVQRRIAGGAADWLASGGTLLVEAGERQAPTASAIMRTARLRTRTVRDEDLDATVVRGTRP